MSQRPAQEPSFDVSNPRHVRALSFDLVGRSPYAGDVELAAGSRLNVLLTRTLRTQEFWEHWFAEELFYFLLIDNARPDDVTTIPRRLHDGELTVPDAVRQIVGGQAFHRANPGPDTFVSVVLEQLLGITVQREPTLLDAGKAMYDGKRARMFGQNGAGQADLVRIVTEQPAFLERLVARSYERLVGESLDKRDLEAATEWLASDPRAFDDLVVEWVASPAYATRLTTLRPKSDRQFVRGLYVDLLDRLPSETASQRLRGALAVLSDAAPLRALAARSLLDEHPDVVPPRALIADGSEFVAEQFRRFLGRDPGPEERQAFQLAWDQQDAEPVTIVRALVTHWEYQTY